MVTSQIYSELLGRTLKLHVYLPNLQNYEVRHDDFRLSISRGDSNNEIDSKFVVVPAINGQPGVSFQSRNYPDRFVRHRGGKCFLEKPSDDPNNNNDFSWLPQVGLDTLTTNGKIPMSFSSNGWFMRHEDYEVNVQKESNASEFKKVATWLIDPKRHGEGIQASGEWKLIASYDGKTDWRFEDEVNVGVQIDKSKSVTETNTIGWKPAKESEESYLGATAKMAFELSGQQSISNMISSAISQSKRQTTTHEYAGGPNLGSLNPTWIWQWVVGADIPGMGTIDAFLFVTQATRTQSPPPEPTQF